MAAREGDTALWLHNKLGSTDDLWSGNSICSQLSRDKLLNIQDCFHNLQPYVKVKLMLSFLHLPKRNVEEWKTEVEEIIQLALDDTDQWVAMVGDILRTYPQTGSMNTDIDDSSPYFHEVVGDLKKLVRKSTDAGMLPLECSFLSKGALHSVAGQQAQPIKHFALKRKPKSAALRAEILQKSTEAAANIKSGVVKGTVPIKIRSFAKKMDDKTPMRGLPSHTPTSGGFMRGSSLNRFGGSTPVRSTPTGKREGGIKLLDITEQPVGAKEAKRRRKQAEIETLEQQKKEKEQQQNTPDYAAGLIPQPFVRTLGNTILAESPGPSYVPSVNNRLPTATTGGNITLPASSISNATQQARESLQQHLQQQLGPTAPRTTTTIITTTTTANPTQITQIAATSNQNGTAPANKKGLSLTREQMLEAQEMFRTSNKVTRPEKALILGFMAGSRENPCPQQGDVVNIRLSENNESISQPDGMFRPMMVDMYFQMDYSTGRWQRIKKFREVDEEEL